ncbi:MAG: hypothetical protein HG467_001715 [Clostridiales bacterium]|nr:hypothetical protein [Clostridiales bacterium]
MKEKDDILNKILVIKRNTRRVVFDGRKIAIAIKKGFDNTDNSKYTDKDVNNVYLKVIEKIEKRYNENPEEGKKIKIEEIQDYVEEVLDSKGYKDVYIEYKGYRENKRKIRQAFEERKKYKFLSIIENMDLIDESEDLMPKQKIYKFGEELSEGFALTHKVKRKFTEQIESGEIYIHDIAYISTGMTGFTQIDLSKIFEEGIEFNNIKINPPSDIFEALNLTSYIFRLLAKEQYYGESIPSFDYFLSPIVLKTFKKIFFNTLENNFALTEFKAFLPMNGIQREIAKIQSIDFDIDIFDQYLRESDVVKNILKKSYEIALNEVNKQLKKSITEFLLNLNILEVEENFKLKYSINTGTDISFEGRMINKALISVLGEIEATNVELVVKIKENINLKSNTPNYDIVVDAIKLKDKNIKYSFLDSKFNKKVDTGDYKTEVAYMNGFRTIENNLDDKRTIVVGRGNLANVTINLASIGLKEISQGNTYNYKKILRKIDDLLNSAKQVLYDRFEEQSVQKKKNYPILLMQNIWLDSDKIKEEDRLRRALKHGSLGISFVGLYEMLYAFGKVKGKLSMKDINKIGLDIIRHMRKKCDEFSEEYTLNFQLMSIDDNDGKSIFIDTDLAVYGKIKNITDKIQYTNSYKLSDKFLEKIALEEKIKYEAAFHEYTNGGHMLVISEKEIEEYDKENNNLIEKKITILELCKKNNVGIVKFY